MAIYHEKIEIKILRVATVADVRDIEERATDEFDVDAVHKKALVVIQAVKPDVVNGRRYKPEEKIAQWCKLSSDERAELLAALRTVGIRDATMRILGDALPVLVRALPSVADEMRQFYRVLDGAPNVPLSFPTGTFLAGLTIICEAPASSDADRERKRALHSVIMHLSDHGYVASDPSRAAVLWSIALSRAGALYGGLSLKAPTQERDDATAMSVFLSRLATDLTAIVSTIERARHTPKTVEIDPSARIRGRNLQFSLNVG